MTAAEIAPVAAAADVATADVALRLYHLVKRYGERTALAGLSLSLPRGCFVALLGPNGAGKSVSSLGFDVSSLLNEPVS